MTSYDRYDDEWFDDPAHPLDDREYPDEDDPDDDEAETIRCEECGAEVYEDAVACPVCGHYLTGSSVNVFSGRPGWWILLGALGIAALVFTLLFVWI
ncbi:MAG: zinc ribbon domain-containing protein [Pirellulales bacterium]|nr:zinc ribbon domain-containing protein [Pirellulales bacterium]